MLSLGYPAAHWGRHSQNPHPFLPVPSAAADRGGPTPPPFSLHERRGRIYTPPLYTPTSGSSSSNGSGGDGSTAATTSLPLLLLFAAATATGTITNTISSDTRSHPFPPTRSRRVSISCHRLRQRALTSCINYNYTYYNNYYLSTASIGDGRGQVWYFLVIAITDDVTVSHFLIRLSTLRVIILFNIYIIYAYKLFYSNLKLY